MAGANLLILGPPKCATSSLHRWIASHPDVTEGRKKELFFLMDAGHPLQGAVNLADDGPGAYDTLFPADADQAPIRIDSTTHYIYQDAALQYAANHLDTKTIAVLRDPAERVFSSFNYTRNNLANLDRDLTFSRYVELVRAGIPLFPEYCRSRQSAWVLERDIAISRYAEHLSKWSDVLGDDRFKVVLFDDVRSAPEKTVGDVFAWLNLADLSDSEREMKPANRTYRVGRQGMHRLALAINRTLPIPRGLKTALGNLYVRLQERGADGMKMSEQDRRAVDDLRRHFESDIAFVEDFTGRNLQHWRDGRAKNQ